MGCAALAAPGAEAKALPAVSGTFSMTSESGDVVGEGVAYRFSAPRLELGLLTENYVTVRAEAADDWTVLLAAPGGDRLERGVYDDAENTPAATKPYLEVTAGTRRCDQVVGSFTVHDVDWGVHHYLESLHVSFVQHCGNRSAPALRGEIEVAVAPPAAPLVVRLMFEPERTKIVPDTGRLELHGSIECSESTTADVVAEVKEVDRADNAVGAGTVTVHPCSTIPTDWELAAESTNGIAFSEGRIEFTVRGEATDYWYSAYHEDGRQALASFEHGGQAEVEFGIERPTAAGWLPGIVARHPWPALLVGIGAIVAAMLATVLATLLLLRRRQRPSDGGPAGVPES